MRSKNGEWRIVQGLPISDKVRTLMQESATELEEERDTAEATLRDAKCVLSARAGASPAP